MKTQENLKENGELTLKSPKDVRYHFVEVEGQQIFYREAGSRNNPTLLLLHGFPSSSHMFRNLIQELAIDYHLIAPDYPGFGNSSMPLPSTFEYTFDHLADIVAGFIAAKSLDKFSLYIMDYGAPIGFRIATRYPEKIQALLVQNGNAYTEGLSDFWNPVMEFWANPKLPENVKFINGMSSIDATKWQYLTGTRNPDSISPDAWIVDQVGLDRDGNLDVQYELFYSYRNNPPMYPAWQAYLKKYQPPTLITWGKGDEIFPAEGAFAYKKDLDKVEIHILNTGHFALEEDGELISSLIDTFLRKNHIKV